MRKNRDRIARSHGDRYAAPAHGADRPSSRGGRGRSTSAGSSRSRASSQRSSLKSPRRSQSPKTQQECYDFQKGKCTRGGKCRYLHKAKSRSPSTQRTPQQKINAVCTYWKKGRCNKGKDCRFLHEDKPKPSEAAHAEQAAPAQNNEKPRSPTPDPKTKKDKKTRGRSKSKDKSNGRTAACLISYAAAAVPNGLNGQGKSFEPKKQLRFKEKPSIREIPLEGKGFKHRTKPRTFDVCYLDADSCRKPPVQALSKENCKRASKHHVLRAQWDWKPL